MLTIAFLTVRAAYRFRLVQVLILLLAAAVVALPLTIKEVGTAQGFTQILITYTLTAITAILGFTTLWLACGTLAREVEECQMQMVVVKPIARWQIWLGKWIGIMILNSLLLVLSGGAVFLLLQWRAHKMTPEIQQVLRNEVLVARGSIKEKPRELEPVVEQVYQQRLRQSNVAATDLKMLKDQVRELVKQEFQLVRPGFPHRWVIDLGLKRNSLRNQPLFLRVKFTTAQKNQADLDNPKTYTTLWQAGVPGTAKVWRDQLNLASDSFHILPLPPNLFDDRGVITIECVNPNDVALLFLLEDGLELLYREGNFGLNFFRGLGIIFCWLAMLASIGLAAASFLSFPVAAFLSLGILLVGFSNTTLAQIVQEGGISGVDHNTGKIDTPHLIDQVAVPVAAGALKLINLVRSFSPIDSLSTGRSITWWQLATAFSQIVLLAGGLFGAAGMILFTRRELATAQGSQ